MNPQTETKSILDNPTVLKRAIIYARVSTDEQAESGTSIDNQVDKSLSYAAAHNLQVVNIFREDYTGKELDRPELNQARDLLRAGLADNLIVYKTNRLDRSEWGLNLLILLQEFKQLGVSLHYSQSGRQIDLTNPVEALMQSIEGWQAGEDHRETVTKLREGRMRRAKEGYVVPHGSEPPYGYSKVRIDKRWHFEIRDDEARIVRLIFTWYVLGDETGQALSLQGIADKLNSMGIKARRGGKWAPKVIRGIVSSETYCGVWRYNKGSDKNEIIPVPVPAIVSREMWEAAHERIEHNKQHARRNRTPGRYLLASRLTCGECGYKMTGIAYHKRGRPLYTYYGCVNKNRSKKMKLCECHLPYFNSHLVDARVWDKLEEVSTDEKQLTDGLRGYQARQEDKVEPVRRELAYVEDLIKDKNAEWEDDYAMTRFLTSDLARAKKAADLERTELVLKELEKRKAELLADLEEKSLTDEQITGTVAFAAHVAENMAILREAEARGLSDPELKLAVYEEKRKLLAILDVQVILFVEDGKRRGRMTAKYCPDGLLIDLQDTKKRYSNRQSWLIFECVIDLE